MILFELFKMILHVEEWFECKATGESQQNRVNGQVILSLLAAVGSLAPSRLVET